MSELSKSGLAKVKRLLGSPPRDGARAGEADTPDQQHQALLLLRDYEQSGLGWFWSTDADGRIAYLSECVATALGKPAGDMLGQPFTSLFTQEADEEGDERRLALMLRAHKTFVGRTVRAATGEAETWWSISGRPRFSATGEFIGYRGNGSDVTATRQSHKDASRLAMYDSLTGLANRHRMTSRLSSILTAYKAAKRSCALMMIDLDRFKQVNDTLGHGTGDELLKQVAQRLQRIVPERCETGRLGGDEFQVILPDIDDRGTLGEIAKKVIAIISQPYSVDGSRCVIGASAGIAIAPYDGILSEELTRSADLALYAAKGSGRGQFRFYSAQLHDEAERRRQIEEDLRDALAKDQVGLVYQPIVETATNRVVALEAALRWYHPALGEVSPEVFIPVAEEANLIGALGDWALRRACADMVELPDSVRVAVNVSPSQFGSAGFTALVAQALAESQILPDRLELELTESIFLNLDGSIDETFAALKGLGVRLALDDFGTGYSSLGYLKKAPFDKIKIDKSFIDGATEPGSRNTAIIKAIVSLAEALDMDTTAEGVETLQELQLIRDLKVNQIQGYVYSRPQDFASIAASLASGEWIIEPRGPSKSRADRMTLLRTIGLIHEDYRYEATMRNLSRTGCLIEGLLDVPVDTQFVIDFGAGQLAVATVRRSSGSLQGLEFEIPLVDDGAGGLVTRNRISPYVLAAAGMPLAALPPGDYPLGPPAATGAASAVFSMPKFGRVNEAGRKAVRLGSN